MREILFRGRRIDNGEWIEGFYFQNPNPCAEDGKPVKHCISDLPPFGAEIIPETIGQYTGLKDKNGRRIFEGDVVAVVNSEFSAEARKYVEVYGKKYHVDMDEGRRGWWPFACGDGCGCCEDDTVNPCECVVIGNVHDQPELLKEV